MSPSPAVLGGRYELQETIGRGGMAEVWRARDLRLDRDVAVKRLRADLATDPTFISRFEREAQSAAGLNHPNIVSVYDTGSQVDPTTGILLPYIVMELVGGRTLREMLREGRTIVPDRALVYTQGVLDALTYSHKHGIIHRDIKPANVMITPTGQVKVMDFGIARAVADTSATMTQTAAVIGTAQYLSPEQARGETVDARSDIYSAGCLLYELLTGRPPFVGDSPVAVAYQHVREQAVPPSQIDPELTPEMDAVTMKALAKSPADRYQDARAMRDDISRLLTGGQVTAQIPVVVANRPAELQSEAATPQRSTGQQVQRKPKRRVSVPTIILLALLAILLTVMGIAAYRLNESSKEPKTTSVPAVIGFTQDQAVSTLKNANLDSQVQQTTGPVDTKGRVLSSNPVADATVPVGSTVTIVVNQGPANGTIPDVRGKTEDEARAALKAAGFSIVTTRDASEDQEKITDVAGTIVATDPAVGSMVDPSTQVTLYRATGRSRVPDVSTKGLTQDQAVAALAAAGFTQVTVVSVPTSEAVVGTVINQVPKAGQLYLRSEAVTISAAVEPSVVPTTITPTPASSPPASPTSPSAHSSSPRTPTATGSQTP
ncbi:serine/threonine protein kinase [Propionibacterium cyclohexanicum]|uniref:non-specific serine/threonine protein kinase n=1 Tax=Propionibacterium cyclohexanicum TaxID=64702 RepID=A0A1H9SZP3_9ACTN|nr:Stk1 family PASTA domain-containing Ser/Thr kinase [Propionibacterium cyclohexanicum]SER90336.1 serine/threonine protein kinase [Propionibacterium cyclohexanicum]